MSINMKLENIFYTIGVFIAIIAIVYFLWEYIVNLPNVSKLIIMIALFVLFFFLGRELERRDK
ncbi:MAG: hypothetical protein ABIE94_07045 [archaeon]